MKRLIYISTLLLLVIASSCKEDTTTPTIDPTTQADREALIQASQIGVYQDGQSEYPFDKTTHQLYISPAQRTIRIQNNAGSQYVELRLSAMPTTEQSVKATLANNVNLKTTTLGEVILLKSDSEHLWLWSETTRTGFILPWINE